MTLISYAQNGEDIVLNRALSDIENGFYIDIGAYDPTEHSVTKIFYDKGWSGINIEPVTSYYERFVAERPRDTNLNIAVGRSSGFADILIVDGTGLSTIDRSVASANQSLGWQHKSAKIPMLTAEQILSGIDDKPIHFLKVDVEGAERDVFQTLDFRIHRPWIVVAEATKPMSQVRSDADWSAMLTGNGYEAIYFDGLNMFFLAEEHASRRYNLAKPPNVFDNYVTIANKKIYDELSDSKRVINELRLEIANLRMYIDEINP